MPVQLQVQLLVIQWTANFVCIIVERSFNLAREMPTDHQTTLRTTDNNASQFGSINDANSINSIR